MIFPTGEVGLHLWQAWLQIARDNTMAASEHRDRQYALGAEHMEFRVAIVREMQASMVAITASAHAIDSVYGEVKALCPSIPQDLIDLWVQKRKGRQVYIYETFKRGCKLGSRTNAWPREFKGLYRLRDPLVHHQLALKPVVTHPNGLADASQESADYSLENARRSFAFAMDVAWTLLHAPVAPDLQRWALSLDHVKYLLELLAHNVVELDPSG